MKVFPTFLAVLSLSVFSSPRAYAQFDIQRIPEVSAALVSGFANGQQSAGRGDFEIVTDAGEKFHLVHIKGTNFDVVLESSGQKIGTANTATGETAASGPDYATNGAAMNRAKAAFLVPGHVHMFDPNSGGALQGAVTQSADETHAPATQADPTATVSNYDAASGEAMIQTAAGPVKFTDKGQKFEVQVKDSLSGRMLTIHGHYVSSDNAGQKAKNGLKSFGFTLATGNVASRQVYVGPAVELYVYDGTKDGPKSAFGLDGIAKDMGPMGAGVAAQTKYRFQPVAISVEAAAKAYEKASGLKVEYVPFFDAVIRQSAGAPPLAPVSSQQ
jgi:hypothetical protein